LSPTHSLHQRECGSNVSCARNGRIAIAKYFASWPIRPGGFRPEVNSHFRLRILGKGGLSLLGALVMGNPPILPAIGELGRDLLAVSHRRVALSLATPFLLAAAFFVLAGMGLWLPAVGCVVALSFFTYGSVSHDLVHRALGLSRATNDFFLTAIELLMFRSGRSYRLAHLNHHARFPDSSADPEGRAAHGSFWAALRSGPFFQPRLWLWAFENHSTHRARLLIEAGAVLALVAIALAAAVGGWSIVPLAYALLVYLGTWVTPLVTSFLPHSPNGSSPLTQTRRFRGWVVRLLTLDHLYHLEHHLYPSVPHHRWRELARRLDPFLDQARVPIVQLGR
jgi:beta-carotene hydroxylase